MPVLQAAKTMPATPGMKTMGFTMRSVVGVAQSPFTLQQQVQEWPGTLWQVKVQLPVMKRATAAAWAAFFASLHGRANTFMLPNSAATAPLGAAGGTPVVNGANNGGFTLATRGWPANIQNILKAGDFFQVGNYMHMVVNPENSDSAGNAAFDIWPSLRATPGDGDAIITSNPKGMFRLTANTPGFDVDEAQIWSFSFECMEAI